MTDPTNPNTSTKLHYPMIDYCQVIIKNNNLNHSSAGSTREPVHLTSDNITESYTKACHDLQNNTATIRPYDFALEHEIIVKHDERISDIALNQASSKEELQQNIVSRMKSVTNTSDDVCISILQSNSYDLKTSIEAFFSN